jgi:hypothetical protein
MAAVLSTGRPGGDMRNVIVGVGVLAAGVAAGAQSMDMAAIQKWTNAKVVQ